MEISNEHLEQIEKINSHLQFLGYETSTKQDDPRELTAKRPSNPSINLTIYSKATRLMCFLNFNDQTPNIRLDRLEYVNSLNFGSIASQFTINEHNILVIQSWMFAPYEKVNFGQFLDVWDEDINKLLKHESSARLLA